MEQTIIQELGNFKMNRLWIKRDDFIPLSFGGNKARKAILFFMEIDEGKYDCVVTYGTASSNHCRVIANQCAGRRIGCYIISPEETSDRTFNRQMTEMFGAELTTVPVSKVRETIDAKLVALKKQGKKPYFIAGGGHGNIGTEAYVQCYKEIKHFEEEQSVHFDYVFFATGTGTTQEPDDNTNDVANETTEPANTVNETANEAGVVQPITNSDNSESENNLPQTGVTEDITVMFFIVVCAILAIYAYKKIRDYKA